MSASTAQARAPRNSLFQVTASVSSRVSGKVTSNAAASWILSDDLENLNLLAGGMPNKQMARVLGVSENTVKFHLKQIFAKLKVDNGQLAGQLELLADFYHENPPGLLDRGDFHLSYYG